MSVAKSEHRCMDCRYWYGAEDDEYGPCQVKQSRGDRRFVTFGGHLCDEPLALAEYGVTAQLAALQPAAASSTGRGEGGIDVRRLRTEELSLSKPLLEPEGWSLETHELARLYDLGGAVGAFDPAGKMVGFLTYVDTPPYRWVGNVCVDPAMRGHGVGARLVEEAYRDAERAALYSVEKAVPLYERAGLVAVGELHAMRAKAARPSSIPYGGVREVEAADIPALLALDRDVTAMDRSRLLLALLDAYPARIVARHGEVLGFAIAKTYAEVTEIGPVVAKTPHAAWGLIDDLIRTTPGPHDLAAHAVTKEAERRGFVPMFRAIPMFKGGAPSWDVARYFAAGGLEKG